LFFLSKNDWSLQYVNNEHQTVCTNYADIQCLHIVFTNMSNKSWHMSNQRDRNKQMLPVTKWRVVLIKHEWSPTIFQATSGVNSECIFFIWWNEQQNTLLFFLPLTQLLLKLSRIVFRLCIILTCSAMTSMTIALSKQKDNKGNTSPQFLWLLKWGEMSGNGSI